MKNNSSTLCQQIKDRYDLRTLASMAGIQLPERDGVKFASPFRPDQNPSCEVYQDHIVDRSSDERHDGIDLYAHGKGISQAEAIKELGSLISKHTAAPLPKAHSKPQDAPSKPFAMPTALPTTPERLQATADSRKLPIQSVEFAAHFLKSLSFAKVCGQDSWLLADRRGTCYEARRIDGKLYQAFQNLQERKCHSKGAGVKGFPMGLLPRGYTDAVIARQNPIILLVEGSADYLAACALVADIPHWAGLPVAMLGKSANIAPEALPYFREKRVMLFGHPDALESLDRWRTQLRPYAQQVEALRFKQGDLNDVISTGQAPQIISHLINIFKL